MEKPGKSHEKVKEKPWKSQGKAMEKSWKSHGKVMEEFNIFLPFRAEFPHAYNPYKISHTHTIRITIK